jgi:hypothetical protein
VHALRFVERVQAPEFIAQATMMIITMTTRENAFEPRLGRPPADQAQKVKGVRAVARQISPRRPSSGRVSAQHPRPLCTRLEVPPATGVGNVTADRGEGALWRQCRRQALAR